MKKFTKLFLSLAAVSVVTAAVATSAMAAEKTLTASYAVDEGGATGTVTITCASEDATKTLLVLKPGSDRTAVKATDILQIDQSANIATAKLPALSADNEDDKGKYTVLMGGDSGDIYVGYFTIGASVLVGDANLSGDITLGDATTIVLHKTNKKVITDETALLAANCNDDDVITLGDATCIVSYKVNKLDKAGHVGELK